MKHNIKLDIVSDVVCPWCYIGKRRLEKAIVQLTADYNFEIEYHPFELNPNIPMTGMNQKEYLTKKFGGPQKYKQTTAHVTQAGAIEGVILNFENQRIMPNTRKAHSMALLAKLEGKQREIIEALFKAYFTDGIDLSSDTNLLSIAEEVGLDTFKAAQMITDERALAQVTSAEQELVKLGIKGVPFYILNDRYGISGAQPTEIFVQALQEITRDLMPTTESCEVDKKNC